ncbi:MAG TPA: hypothetical protein VNG12_10800 [Acidimicrobiales bacterium]|nr:hypothetical protein [Acidimicrobiales bacterium]
MIPSNVEAAWNLILARWPYRAINPAVAETWRRVLTEEPSPSVCREAYEEFAATREFIPDPAEFRAQCLAIRKRQSLEAVPEPDDPDDPVVSKSGYLSRFLKVSSR